jgi:hypothetical protein
MAKSATAFYSHSKKDDEELKPLTFHNRPLSATTTEKRKSVGLIHEKGLIHESRRRGSHSPQNAE